MTTNLTRRHRESVCLSLPEGLNHAGHITFRLRRKAVVKRRRGRGFEGNRLPVRRTSKQGLRTVTFTKGGPHCAASERNHDKPGSCGELAWSGHQVVQFEEVQTNRFMAVAVDGEAKEYGGGKNRGQPVGRRG